MTNQYTFEEMDAMCAYQEALIKYEQLEDELMLCDYTDPQRYEIDRQMTQLEYYMNDLLSSVKKENN